MIFIMILSVLLIILILVFLLILNSARKYLGFLNKLVKNFNDQDNGIPGSSSHLILYLHDTFRMTLKSSSTYLFTRNGNHFDLNSYSLVTPQDTNFSKMTITPVNHGDELKGLTSQIKGKLNNFRSVVIPLYQEDKIMFIYAVLFKSTWVYLNAVLMMFIFREYIGGILENLLIKLFDTMRNDSLLLLESIKDYAFVMPDMNLKITSWNKGSEIMFGYVSEEQVNTPFIELIDDHGHKNIQ